MILSSGSCGEEFDGGFEVRISSSGEFEEESDVIDGALSKSSSSEVIELCGRWEGTLKPAVFLVAATRAIAAFMAAFLSEAGEIFSKDAAGVLETSGRAAALD